MKLTNCEKLVLENIKYWLPKSKTTFEGRKWVIQTAEEIVEHIENRYLRTYHLNTIWKALTKLRELRLVETLVKPHRFKIGVPASTWITLSEKGEIKTSEKEELKSPKGRNKNLPKGEIHITDIITDNITELYQGEEASSSEEKMGNDMVELPEEKYQGFGSKGKGAKAILDKFNKVKSETDLRIYPCTPITFFNFYKSVYAKHHGYIGEVSNPVLI